MFCSQCGTENPDNAVFCKECGYQIIKDTQNNTNEESIRTVDGVLTKIFSSGLFLALAIISTIRLTMTVFSVDFSNTESLLPSVSATSFVSIFSIIITVCMWIIYANAKNGKGTSVSSLKAIGVVEKIRFILSIVLASVCALLAISGAIFMALANNVLNDLIINTDTFSEVFEEIFARVPELQIMITQYPMEKIVTFGLMALIFLLILSVIFMVLLSIFAKLKYNQINKIILAVKENRLEEKIASSLKVFLILFTVFSFLSFGIGGICEGIINILLINMIGKINNEIPIVPQE